MEEIKNGYDKLKDLCLEIAQEDGFDVRYVERACDLLTREIRKVRGLISEDKKRQ